MTQTVHLFVFDTLADWEPGYAIAGINSPEHQKHPGKFQVKLVAEQGREIVSSGGMRIVPDLTLDEISPSESAMLILPGGGVWDAGGNDVAIDAARRWIDAGVPVAAICGATFGLARGGLLDARRHTSNAAMYLASTGYKGGHLYEDTKAVTADDQLLITAGSMWPLEFAYEIFRRLDLYSEDALESWYGLFSTGELRYFKRLVELEQAASSS
jgi:putative intracellular protease/amidase